MSGIAKHTKKSTWTPLTNEEANQKIFEERRTLVSKWFEKWSDNQRKIVIADVVKLCKGKQLDFTGDLINQKKPVYKDDFTRVLPRVLTIYILSFLDPRSLCRSAQVCWYWKYLTELDHLWMPKCCSVGWILSFSPSPFENGVWKKLYIENIIALKLMAPKTRKKDLLEEMNQLKLSADDAGQRAGKAGSKRPPWRGTDPNPKDMWRNNYLENSDDVDKVNKLRQKHLYGSMADEIIRKAKNKVRSGEHAVFIKAMHAERSKSAHSYYPGERPDWAQTREHSAPFMDKALVKSTPNATVRPSAPTNTTEIAKAMKERSTRQPPSKPLFPSETSAWELHVPNNAATPT